mgnify:CR=1 FL=1
MVFLNSDSKATLAVGIYRLMSGEIFDWQAILASSTMMVFPILVIYLFLINLLRNIIANSSKVMPSLRSIYQIETLMKR